MKYSDGIKDIAVRLQDDVPITAEEMDCLGLRYMDALLIIIAFYLGSLFLSAAVPILIKTFIHGAKLTVYVFNTIFSFGVALERPLRELKIPIRIDIGSILVVFYRLKFHK